MDRKKVSYCLMVCVVFLWGFDYSVAKTALEVLHPFNLLFFKYAGAFLMVTALKLIVNRKFVLRKQELVFFILCSLTGQILYYLCEYSAIEYIPVSLITIMLSFVPIVSIIIERVVYGNRFSTKIVVWLLVCVAGITLVIGADLGSLFTGRAVGYLLAFGAVLSWNAYNFITKRITDGYDSLIMGFNQLLCTVLISAPYAIGTMPPAEEFSPQVILGILYLGLCSAGPGYLIMVRGIRDLGPTVASIFSNFLPVTSTFFGWLVLGQYVSPLQIAGGAVVVAASCVVIIEKARLDRLRIIDRL